MSWKDASKRGQNFLARFPLFQRPTAANPLTTFTKPDIDGFAQAHGYYGNVDWTVSADVDRARNVLINQLRDTGLTERWRSEQGKDQGFAIKVIGLRPTIWQVQPLHINASHTIHELPQRNATTVRNRASLAMRKVNGVSHQQVSGAERKHLRRKLQHVADTAINASQIEATAVQQITNMETDLRKKDPNSPLLP